MTAEKLDSTLHNHLVSRGRRSAGDLSPLRPEELGPVQEDALHRVERYLKFLKGLGDPELRKAIDKHQTTILKGVQSGIAESTRSATRGGEPPRKTRGMDLAKAALGERPSFLVINNEICLDSSLADPAGWQILLDRPEVRKALKPRFAAVGLIIDEGTLALGTGFVVAPNLVMTNRHVVENMFDLNTNSFPVPFLPNKSQWYINFSQEFGGSESADCEARITGLRFVSKEKIVEPDSRCPQSFSQSDVAVLEIDTPRETHLPIADLSWGSSMSSDEVVLVVGHPFFDERYKKQFDETTQANRIAFDQVFGKHFEFKHAAPGYARAFAIPSLPNRDDLVTGFHPEMNLMHDSSTLGGNSGSPLFTLKGRCEAVGLHLWGQAKDVENEISNLAHSFSALANCPNHDALKSMGIGLGEVLSGRTLKEDGSEQQSRGARSVRKGRHGVGRSSVR